MSAPPVCSTCHAEDSNSNSADRLPDGQWLCEQCRPVGLHCPGCGGEPIMRLGPDTYCGNENCSVFSWNPTKQLAEMEWEGR